MHVKFKNSWEILKPLLNQNEQTNVDEIKKEEVSEQSFKAENYLQLKFLAIVTRLNIIKQLLFSLSAY